MTIPDYQSLMLPVLVACSKGEVSIRAVVEQLADQLGLSPEDRSELLPSGKQTVFNNRVHWAKTYLAQAGLIENTRRGHFAITPRGEQTLASHPAHIDNAFLSRFDEFKQFKERARVSQSKPDFQAEPEEKILHETETPDEIMRRAHRQINATLAQELLGRVRAASPQFFERLIVDLLLSMGYAGSRADKAARTLGHSGDDGVDGVIDQDALGLDRVYIQAKRYAAGNNIGPSAIRDFFGSLDRYKASKSLFVTTSTFSPSANETAELLSRRIVLIDGDHLAALMVQHNIGCRIEDILHIKKIDEEFF
jgi:restriction system protein